MSAPRSGARSSNGMPVPQLILLRKQACLSQRNLADRAGLSLQTITRLEHGANARYDTICLLSQALQVSPARLIRRRRLQKETPC